MLDPAARDCIRGVYKLKDRLLLVSWDDRWMHHREVFVGIVRPRMPPDTVPGSF